MYMENINLKSLIYNLLFPMFLSFILAMLLPDYGKVINDLVKPNLYFTLLPFLIMWLILYVLMGISAYIIENDNNNNNESLKYYYIQLFVNLAWFIVFFLIKSMLFSIIWSVVLLCLVIMTFAKFYKINKLSGYLLIPYIAWSIYIVYFTISIYILN